MSDSDDEEIPLLVDDEPGAPTTSGIVTALVGLVNVFRSLLAPTTSVHVTALDCLVNVNSLFTIAVFIGLSLTTSEQLSLENRTDCDAGIDVYKWLYLFEVLSFSSFLFSSLVAQGLKLAINILNSKDVDEAFRAHINLNVMGCLFLISSMVNVIQIRLGMLSCGSISAVIEVAVFVISVFAALFIYIFTAIYAFRH